MKRAGDAIAQNLVDYFDNVSLALYDEAEYAEIDVYELWSAFDKITKKDKKIIRLDWKEFERNTWPYIEKFMTQFIWDIYYLEDEEIKYIFDAEDNLYTWLLDRLDPSRT